MDGDCSNDREEVAFEVAVALTRFVAESVGLGDSDWE